MWPDRVSNSGPLAHESDTTALRDLVDLSVSKTDKKGRLETKFIRTLVARTLMARLSRLFRTRS